MRPRTYLTQEDASECCRHCGALCEEPDGLCYECWADEMDSILEDDAMDVAPSAGGNSGRA